MMQYYSIKYLCYTLKRGKSRICASLLKYGYSNFSLEILEYCSASEVILREQHYLDLLKPEYNILPVAGSRFGIPHTALTKEKLRASWTKERKAMQSEYGKRMENLNRLKKLNLDPVMRAKRINRLKILHLDPNFRVKRLLYLHSDSNLSHLKKLNSGLNIQAKRLKNFRAFFDSEAGKQHLNKLHTDSLIKKKAVRILTESK